MSEAVEEVHDEVMVMKGVRNLHWVCNECTKTSRKRMTGWRARRYARRHLERLNHKTANIMNGEKLVFVEVNEALKE